MAVTLFQVLDMSCVNYLVENEIFQQSASRGVIICCISTLTSAQWYVYLKIYFQSQEYS